MSAPIHITVDYGPDCITQHRVTITPEIARQIVALGMGSMPLNVAPDGTARPLSAALSAEITALRAQLASRPSPDVAIGLAYCAAEDDLRGQLGEARAEAEKLAGLLREARPDLTDAACRGQVAGDIIERIDAALAARAKGEL